MPPHFKQEILTCSQYSIVLLATILVLSNTRQYLFFSSAIAWVKELININPFDNKWVWERYLVKAKGCNWARKADVTTLWTAPSSHHHTENLSGEMCRYLPQNIQRKGRAGKKSSKIHCTRKEHSGSEMIDLSESAVKLLKPKTTQHMISDGDCWPALSPAKPWLNL